MFYYFLVVIAAVLYTLQFFCQQKYEAQAGTGLDNALSFSFYKGMSVILLMLFLSGFQPQFTWFSAAMSGLFAICYILMIYFSLKAFSVANLSVYSVFTMLGGMLLPFVVGVAFYSEGLSIAKVICCLLVVFAVLLNIRKGSGTKQAFIYYMLVFLLNGCVGVISKVHESAPLPRTDPQSFMLYSGIWTILICAVWLRLLGKPIPLLKGTQLLCAAGDGFLNGFGDLLLLIAIAKLPASVQYPLVTGGVMVFSTLLSILQREKLSRREYIAAVIAFVASVMMAF